MTGEGEAAQAVTAGQAVNENRRNDEPGYSYTLEGPAATKQILDDYIQHSLAMVRTTQEQKLDKIDAALDAVEA